MRLNWKRFASLFLLFNVILLCTGCAPGWITAISALLPAISAAVSAILAFVMSLQGKTVTPATVALIQKIESDVKIELDNVQKLIAAAQSGGTTVLGQIKAIMQSVLDNISSILSGLPVSDSSTLQKITELVALAIAAVQAILAIIPVAMVKLAEKPGAAQLAALDNATANHLKAVHKEMQARYVEIIAEPTTNSSVTTALAALPQQLP